MRWRPVFYIAKTKGWRWEVSWNFLERKWSWCQAPDEEWGTPVHDGECTRKGDAMRRCRLRAGEPLRWEVMRWANKDGQRGLEVVKEAVWPEERRAECLGWRWNARVRFGKKERAQAALMYGSASTADEAKRMAEWAADLLRNVPKALDIRRGAYALNRRVEEMLLYGWKALLDVCQEKRNGREAQS